MLKMENPMLKIGPFMYKIDQNMLKMTKSMLKIGPQKQQKKGSFRPPSSY